MLHGIHCIHSRCKNPLNSIRFHFFTLHGINCIQSCFIKSTAFNWDAFYQAAWNPLHSIMLHKIHCIQSGCILPRCKYYTYSITMHGFHCLQSGCFWPCCIKSTAFNHAAWNPVHPIGILWVMLHKIQCIQSCCTVSTAFSRDVLGHAAENSLH